jgi:hypothetical protein
VGLFAVVSLIGGFVQLVGLIVAARGFRETWTEFGDSDQKFFAPVTARLDRLTIALNRLFHVPMWTSRVEAQVALGAGMTDSVRARTSWGPLPSISGDPEKFAEEVQRRLDKLHQDLQTTNFNMWD